MVSNAEFKLRYFNQHVDRKFRDYTKGFFWENRDFILLFVKK